MTEFVLGATEVAEIDHTLERLHSASATGKLKLAFNERWAAEGPGPSMLLGALIGSLGHIDIEVETVEADDDRLLRFGVASALQRRKGLTSFGASATALNNPRLGLTWTPGRVSMNEALFEPGAAAPGAPAGIDHATFVNAHLAVTASGSSDVTFLVRRWLTRKLPDYPHVMGLAAMDGLVERMGYIIDQLLSNVREHAVGAPETSTESILQLSLDSHAGRPSLSCSVFDNGPGIEATLRPKLDAPVSKEFHVVLAELCKGNLPGWGAARGIGLAAITAHVQQLGGAMTIATEASRLDVTKKRIAGRAEAFGLLGTLVSLNLPLDK